MKRILNLSVIFVFVFSSCTRIIERRPGDWDDNIHLSVKVAEFDASGDSITIKTEGSWWWITGISVDNKNYIMKDVYLQAESYSLKQDCFDVKRLDKNTLFIKVEANPKNVKRIISIGLEAGDYFDYVTITQRSKL